MAKQPNTRSSSTSNTSDSTMKERQQGIGSLLQNANIAMAGEVRGIRKP